MRSLTKAEKTDSVISRLALILIFLAVTAVCLLFAGRKSGMFIDEIYSYGLSNSHFAPYIADIHGGELKDTLLTRQELEGYLAVSGGEQFDARSVYYNQTRDVHPPLYYWFLNFVCSVFSDAGFTKWTALGLNLVFYLAALAVLFCIAAELGCGAFSSAACTAAYGLSVIGLSTFLMIRMYALLTLLTLLLALWIVRLLKTGNRKYCIPVFLSVFLGMITQYYFVFYAFFVCLACCILFLARKEGKSFALFAASALAGVAAAVGVFPACLKHIFVGNGEVVSGTNAVENLADTGAYAERIVTYLKAFSQAKSLLWLLIFSALAGALCIFANHEKTADTHEDGPAMAGIFPVVFLPALFTFLLVAVLSPVLEKRYIYNIIPFFALAAVYLTSENFLRAISGKKLSFGNETAGKVFRIVLPFAVLGASLWEARALPPDYLYPETAERMEMICENADLPCVYFSGNYSSPVTSDLLYLRNFQDVFVTDDTESEALKDYIGGSDRYVLFISNSWYWAGSAPPWAALSCMQENTGYSAGDPLFEGDMSLCYLMNKNPVEED